MVTGIQKKKALIEVLLFFLRLNLLLIPFYAIIYFNWSYYPIQIIFASIVTFIIRLFGFQIAQSDFFLFLGEEGFPIDISFDCVGWKSSYSLFALVLATPGDIKRKGYFLVKWIPVMLAINILRVITIVLIGFIFDFNLIQPIHTLVFQPLMMLVVIGIWFIWLKKMKIYRKKN